jgi:hypothetical protein
VHRQGVFKTTKHAIVLTKLKLHAIIKQINTKRMF